MKEFLESNLICKDCKSQISIEEEVHLIASSIKIKCQYCDCEQKKGKHLNSATREGDCKYKSSQRNMTINYISLLGTFFCGMSGIDMGNILSFLNLPGTINY